MKPRIRTYSGLTVNPLDLQVSDIRLIDIAHHLACVNRFAGALKKPVSVAQHSVFVSRLVDGTGHELEALFHDAAEAYLGDVTKWLKGSDEMAAYRVAEDRAQCVINEALGLRKDSVLGTMPDPIEWADRVMVRYEGREGFGNDFNIDHPRYPPLTEEEIKAVGVWRPWTWQQARESFLVRYRVLTGAAGPLPNGSFATVPHSGFLDGVGG